MTCPTCGCAVHVPVQTWVVRCSVCRREKYPIAVSKPTPDWACVLCRATPPEKREVRVRRAGAGLAAIRGKAGTSQSDVQGAPEGPGAA